MTTFLLILLVLAVATTLSACTIRHDRAERPVASVRAHEYQPPEPARPW